MVENTVFYYMPFPDPNQSTNYSTYLPQSILQTDQNGNTTSLIDRMQFDSKGNPIYMSKNGSTKVVYLWGYSNQNRIAKIEGVTYDAVVNAIGSDLINKLAAETNPTKDEIEQIRAKINSSGLTAMVTTYSYSPLIGMVTATDPKGVTTNYTYDTFNRFFLARNDDKKILARYLYGYQNAPDNGLGGYSNISATLSTDATSYMINTSGTATVKVSGGSGNLTYTWTLIYAVSGGTTTTYTTTTPTLTFTGSMVANPLVIICAITDNQLGFSTSVTTTVSVVSSAYTMQTGYATSYNGIAKSGSTVNAYLSFYPTTSTMQVGTAYYVANVMAAYRPSTLRTTSISLNGRVWTISIYPNGNLYFTINSGTALAVNNGVTLSFTYAL